MGIRSLVHVALRRRSAIPLFFYLYTPTQWHSSLLMTKPGPQLNSLGADVESAKSSNGAARRKKSGKAVPLMPGETRPSTGGPASLHRRTPSVSSMETIRGKPSSALPKSTEPYKNAYHPNSNATTSRKLKDKLNPASCRTPVPVNNPVHDEVNAGPGTCDDSDITLCNVSIDDELCAAPVGAPFSAPPAEFLPKQLDELLSTANPWLEQKAKAELIASWIFPKTKPSPLQDLSLNTGLGRSLAVPLTPPGVQWDYVTSVGTTEDKFGCVQLGVAELAMQITFYQKPHFEIWDMPDNAYIHWPAQINLIVKNAAQWAMKPLTLPDIRMIDIQCCTKLKPSIYSEFDTGASYATYYTGSELHDEQGEPLPLTHERGITIKPEWVRSYGKTTGTGGNSNERGISIGKRGWYMRIWVPIPMKLFVKRETRSFLLQTCVWIGDDEGDFVECKEEMTISHLRREREMI